MNNTFFIHATVNHIQAQIKENVKHVLIIATGLDFYQEDKTCMKVKIILNSDLKYCEDWGKWLSNLKSHNKIRRLTLRTPLGARLGSGTQPLYKFPGNLRVEVNKTKKHTHTRWMSATSP